MADLILDSGALIAYEREDRHFWILFKAIQSEGGVFLLPAPVLAQVWRRPTQVRVTRLMKSCTFVSMDVGLAREAGELLAATSTTDVVDAVVAALARRSGADIATSDPRDISRLLDAAGSTSRIISL